MLNVRIDPLQPIKDVESPPQGRLRPREQKVYSRQAD